MTLTGTITHIVARKIAEKSRVVDFGLDGQRLRISGFSKPEPVIPPIGTRVAVRLDRSGYVQEITAVPDVSAIARIAYWCHWAGVFVCPSHRGPESDRVTQGMVCILSDGQFCEDCGVEL